MLFVGLYCIVISYIFRFVIFGAQVTAREQDSGAFVRAFASSFVLCSLFSRAP